MHMWSPPVRYQSSTSEPDDSPLTTYARRLFWEALVTECPESHIAIIHDILPVYRELYEAAFPKYLPEFDQPLSSENGSQSHTRFAYLYEYALASAKNSWAYDSSSADQDLSDALTAWVLRYNLREKWIADGVLHICENYACKPDLIALSFEGSLAEQRDTYSRSLDLMYKHSPNDTSRQYGVALEYLLSLIREGSTSEPLRQIHTSTWKRVHQYLVEQRGTLKEALSFPIEMPPIEWNPISEKPDAFKKRAMESFSRQLDEQTALIESYLGELGLTLGTPKRDSEAHFRWLIKYLTLPTMTFEKLAPIVHQSDTKHVRKMVTWAAKLVKIDITRSRS